MEKKISVSTNVKFSAGDTAYYCTSIKNENSEIQSVTIKSVHLAVKISPKSRSTQIRYKIHYKPSIHTSYGDNNYMTDGLVTEKNLYYSKTEIYEAERNHKKKALQRKTATYRAVLKSKELELTKIREALDEIKKEELIENLSGILTKKKKK